MSIPYYWLVSCLSPQYYGKGHCWIWHFLSAINTKLVDIANCQDMWVRDSSLHEGLLGPDGHPSGPGALSWLSGDQLYSRLDDTIKLLELKVNLIKLVYFSGGFSTLWDRRKPSSPGQGHRPSTLCDLSSLFGFHLMDGRKCTAIPEVCYFHANPLEVSKFWFSWL